MKKKGFTLILILLIFIITGKVFSAPFSATSDLKNIFKEGNLLYEKEDYKGAISAYTKIINEGVENSEVFYNIGNSYFKIGDIGKSILYYQKALKISPRDQDIRQNLTYVHSLTLDKQPEEQLGLSHILFSGLNSLLSINELTIIVLTSYIILCIWGFIYIFWNRKKFYLKIIGGILLLPFIISTLFFCIRIYDEENNKQCIVMAKEQKVRSGPGDDYTEVFSIHEGSMVLLRQNQGDWSQITLPNGYSGWIKFNSLEKI